MRGQRHWFFGLFFAGALVASFAPVHAQGQAPTDAELSEEEARALFGAGLAAFEAGRFQDALWSFQRAYDRSGRAELLYNVGQCHDRMREDEQAIAAFERYLELVPTAPNRMQVEGRIRALREVIARRNAPPDPVVRPVPTPTDVATAAEAGTSTTATNTPDAPSHRGRRIAWISTAAVVVVAAVVTTVLVVHRTDGYGHSDVGVVFALRGGMP